MELAGAGTIDTRAPWPLLPVGDTESASHLLKRALDVALTLPLLVLALPVMLVAVVLVKLTSPGPAFYLSPRRGRGEEEFRMFKLRTMVDGAASMQESLACNARGALFFKVRGDPRVTPVGRLLRRYSIDELPQLLNVLRGEMSLVGPRPLLLDEAPRLPPGLRCARARVRPGITGLWQVLGRSNCPDDERVSLDRRYLDEWSVELDLAILLRTIPTVISGRGAE